MKLKLKLYKIKQNFRSAAVVGVVLLGTVSSLSAYADSTSSPEADQFQQLVAQMQSGDSSSKNLLPPMTAEEKAVNQQAFKQVVHSVMPLNNDQIRYLRNQLDSSKRAAATDPTGTPPKPTSTTLQIDLSPGSTPPVVRLHKGYVSSVIFVDATGKPWPIGSYDIADPKNFSLHVNTSDKNHNVMVIQSMTDYREGNLAVFLRGLNTPIMLDLIPGQKIIDYRVDMRVPKLGPNADIIPTGMATTNNQSLMNTLDDVPPANWKSVDLGGARGQAWIVGGDTSHPKMFLRTPLTLLSPSWSDHMSSADGMNAYELPETSTLLLMDNGQVTHVLVRGI